MCCDRREAVMSRSRVSTARDWMPDELQPLASSGGAVGNTPGAIAAAAWLRDRGVTAPTPPRWHVEISLDVINQRPPTDFDDATATRFHLSIYAEEWGVYFCHRGRSSWIRITDVAFVHGRDDFKLVGSLPPLKDVGTLVRRLEQEHQIRFQRKHASIRTNIPAIEPAVRSWIATL